MTATVIKSKSDKSVTSRTCLCGCGAPTNNKFAMGHDAKLKSQLLVSFRTDGLSGQQRRLVDDLNWERFMTPGRVRGAAKTQKVKETLVLGGPTAGIVADDFREEEAPTVATATVATTRKRHGGRPMTADGAVKKIMKQYSMSREDATTWLGEAQQQLEQDGSAVTPRDVCEVALDMIAQLDF